MYLQTTQNYCIKASSLYHLLVYVHNSAIDPCIFTHTLIQTRPSATAFTLFSNASIIFSATLGAAAALSAPYTGFAN
jgi:hypothetical protein